MSVALYPQPRDGALPFAAATLGFIVCVLALPVVWLLYGSIAGWALGAGLWTVNWTLSQMATKYALSASPTTAVGVSGISMMFRAFFVAIVIFAVAVRVSHAVGVTAAIVFLAAFTFDLMGRVFLFHLNERERQTANEKGPADS
jgi:hypothetical protein